jgi:hypothetical protein
MPHQCHYCTDVFKLIYQCYQHTRVAHKDAVQKYWIPCTNCQKYFPNKKSLISHKQNHCLVCDYCNKLLTTTSHLRNHVEQNHPEEMSKHWTKCSACDKKFRVGLSFKRHWSFCQRNQIGCQVSKTSHLSANDQLNNGIMAQHCQFCTKVFKSISQCYQHARVDHKDAVQRNWFSCPHCKKYFPTKKSLNRHKCLVCIFCNKVLSSRNQLTNHIDQNHIDQNHIDQNHIDQNHIDQNHIDQNHIDQNHIDQNDLHEEPLEEWKYGRDGSNRHQIECQVCKETIKVFNADKTNTCLDCEHCNKVMNSRNERRNHIEQNHLEEAEKREKKCSACDNKFRIGQIFKAHWNKCQQNQVGCQICKEIFRTKDVMLAHARVMHVTHVELFWSSSCPDCKLKFPSMAEVTEHVCLRLRKLSSTKNDLNLDNIDVSFEWLLSKETKRTNIARLNIEYQALLQTTVIMSSKSYHRSRR